MGGVPMKRWVLVVAVPVMVLGLSSPASALTKVRSEVPLLDHAALTGFCPFTIYETDEGRIFQDVWLDESGNLVKIAIHSPGVWSTYEANGKSIRVQNSGPVFITIDENGVITAEQRGQSVSSDQGLITGNPYVLHVSGRITTHAVYNETTGYVDFIDSVRIGLVTDICAELAP
jgi:hypothetical protein